MSTLFTLNELVDPRSGIGSTIAMAASMKAGVSRSFSIPPFLFYAMKAKMLAGLRVENEEDALKHAHVNVHDATLKSIRDAAKQVYSDLDFRGINTKRYTSTLIQDHLLRRLMGESIPAVGKYEKRKAISINASRIGKNVTIPAYLMDALIDVVGNKTSARTMIHETVKQIRHTLEAEDLLDEQRNILGTAGNASWSRKVHNILLMNLLQMSGIKEMRTLPRLAEIKLVRAASLEIAG
jgi:hypothetical protein